MDDESWIGPLCLFVGMAVLGAAILFGKDWIERRGRQGELGVPPTVLTVILTVFGVVVFLWFALAVVVALSARVRH